MVTRVPRLIIFDWDGTLMNSVDHIVDCLERAATENGLPILEKGRYQSIIGLGLKEAFDSLYPEEGEAVFGHYRSSYAQYFVEGLDNEHLFDGVIELIETLAGKGIELAIATGKSRKGLDRVLPASSIRDYFATSRCADETESKPSPLMLHEICAEIGVAETEAVMVGDTSFDLDMARRAGVPSIGVSYGAHQRDQLEPFSPLFIADKPLDLLKLFD